MTESFIAIIWFWIFFAFTPGPFWTAVMRTAVDFPFRYIYAQYTLYCLTGWLGINITVGVVVSLFGRFSPAFIAWMHIAGVLVLAWLTYKMTLAQQKKGEKFDFNWKVMNAITWSNPKCWLLIPIGFLGANFSDQMIINIALFYVLGLPLFYGCLFLWGSIGKLGAQVSLRGITLFNLLLMAAFALYLGWNGYVELLALYG